MGAEFCGRDMLGVRAEPAAFMTHMHGDLLEALIEDPHQSTFPNLTMPAGGKSYRPVAIPRGNDPSHQPPFHDDKLPAEP